jgi:hypothetical protein
MSLQAPDARAQLSPGPLARAHAQLEGHANCLRCHGVRRADSMDAQCLACHGEIAWQIERRLGLHGRDELDACARCHPDHAGADFELIHWEEGSPEKFDHDRTGWPLSGRHASAACRACHKQGFQVGEVVERIKRADRDRSWLGLVRDCTACHADRHDGTLGADCARCHSDRVWKPAGNFDHARSDYPLTGKHAAVSCERCHLVPGRIFLRGTDGAERPRYRPLPHAECSDCHADAHAGRLGAACASCHVTDGFQRVDRERFDHEHTRYPLRGRHRALACAACHDPRSAWGRNPPFERCDSCHRDAHAGGATIAGRPADCAACHDERSFVPSTFTVADHDRTDYALEGGHRRQECRRCHPQLPPGPAGARLGSSRVLLRPPHAACRDCHADLHGGQLASIEGAGACESCHTVAGFRPTTFDLTRHAATAFPLAGRHAAAACADCHGPARRDLGPLPAASALGQAGVALTVLSGDCASCHLDPHDGRFARGGERALAQGCRSCHGFDHFRPSAVDAERHRAFAYPLDGAHLATPCSDCHAELREPASQIHLLHAVGQPRRLTFVATHDRCEACHATPHGDQFAGRPRSACRDCHDVRAFRPAPGFDHERDAAFALGRAHRGVRCAACHPTRGGADGRAQVIYRPLARECEDCHAPRRGAAS